MLSLHTNAASLSTQNSLGSTNKALASSMTKLGTGYRVNSAMDDAAGLQIATRLNAQTAGMKVAQKNTQNGISMMQTAEGAFAEMTNILIRMKDLATESATASTTEADRDALQAEYDALGAEMGNIILNTSFGGSRLFQAEGGTLATDTAGGLIGGAALTFQIGSATTETMELDVTASLGDLLTALDGLASTYSTGVVAGTPGTEISGTATTAGNGKLADLTKALDLVGAVRSQLGATSNRLEHVFNNLGNMIQNTSAAMGRIMDVDYATETSNMTSKQMLMQASTSMLKQSNSMSQMVASLLQ